MSTTTILLIAILIALVAFGIIHTIKATKYAENRTHRVIEAANKGEDANKLEEGENCCRFIS